MKRKRTDQPAPLWFRSPQERERWLRAIDEVLGLRDDTGFTTALLRRERARIVAAEVGPSESKEWDWR